MSPTVGTAQAGSESLIWGRSWPGPQCLQMKGHCLLWELFSFPPSSHVT